MRSLFLSVLLLLAACVPVSAKEAKIKVVEGVAVFYIPATMTRAQAVEEAIRRAKIDALSKAFGISVVSANTSIATQDDDKFYSNGFDLVKGEWIETVGEPEIKVELDGDEVFLTVRIKGRAREKETSDVDIAAKVLRNGTTENCEAAEFKNGDKMYVHFTSPVDGYVSIYQYDPVSNTVYCLLPYRKDGAGSVRVEHDVRYVFFSKQHSDNPRMVDEYRLGCSEDGETNTLYILFSPNAFSKSQTDVSDKYTPRSLPFGEFERWKAKCQTQDARLQIVTKNIIINN